MSERRPASRNPAWREGLAVLEPGLLAMNGWELARQPRGDGRVVFVLPGWRADDASTAPLRAYLRGLGYDARGWGLGTNAGRVRENVESMIGLLEPLVARRRGPLPLVGWSLGGVVAREVARARPELVEQVITMGSPINTGRGRRRRPINVPITAICTKGDAIVPWESCFDYESPNVRNVEVHTTHLGLGLHHRVYVEVAQALARGAALSRP